MKVLHVCPYMHASAGGPPIVVQRLLEVAGSCGWSGRVITTSLLCSDDGKTLEKSLRASIDATVLPRDRPRLLGLSSAATAAIESGVADADIVHSHTLWHPLNGMVRRACRRHGRRYVLMPHGMLDPYSLSVKALRKRLYLRLSERRNLESAARVLFTTVQEEQLARMCLPWLGESEVIALGGDGPPPDVEVSPAQFRAAYPMLDNRRCMIFMGRLHPKKGLEYLLSALPEIVKTYPDVCLIVAGSGAPAYVQSVREHVASAGLSAHVIFTGMLLGDLKWAALSTSECFLLPSYQENFAIAVAEAMQMGLPVVVTERVNIWRDIESAGAGVVVEHGQLRAALATAIVDLLASPARAREMGLRAKQFAQEHYTWGTTAKRTYSLYDRLLDAPAAKTTAFQVC